MCSVDSTRKATKNIEQLHRLTLGKKEATFENIYASIMTATVLLAVGIIEAKISVKLQKGKIKKVNTKDLKNYKGKGSGTLYKRQWKEDILMRYCFV